MQNISEIKSLLLTWEEYNTEEFSVPYVYRIEKGEQVLVYFGAQHNFDPSSPQFKQIGEEWEKFSLHSKKLAIAEGNKVPLIPDVAEAIKQHGERGYLSNKAHEAGVELLNPDPTEQELWESLLGTYTKDQIFLYDVFLVAYQWNLTDKTHSFEKYIEKYFQSYKQRKIWSEYDFSLNNIYALHKQFFTTEFDPNDKHFFYDQIDPSQKISVFNELSREMDVIRDSKVVQAIYEKWQEGYSIFVVFGSGHAVIQERALRTLLQ